MVGSLTLESALSPELSVSQAIPTITAISLSTLMPDHAEEMTAHLYGGFYQLYFPWLTAPAQVLDATSSSRHLKESYAVTVPYIEDRIGRISTVQKTLGRGGIAVTMTSLVRLRWTLPVPDHKPESLETTFYELHATEAMPFLRYFPEGGRGAPLMKLGLQPDGTPIISDDKVFARYLNEVAPTATSAVILAKAPIVSAHVERGAAFTIFLFADGTSDITLEVPQRGATYIAAVAADAQDLLRSIVAEMGFAPDTVPILRDIHASYKWSHPDPRRSAPITMAKLQERVKALTPFLETVPALPDEKALGVFQWRAVSNYEAEPAQFAYITQLVLRGETIGGRGEELMEHYKKSLTERFGMTVEAATVAIGRWFERREDAVAAAAVGATAVAAHSTGASIAITGAHPDYTLEVQHAESYEDLQRIMSVMGVLLGAPTTELHIKPPAPILEKVAVLAAAEVANTASASAAAGGVPEDIGEMDPALAALMADLGIGGDAEEEEASTSAADAPSFTEQGPALVIEELEGGAGTAGAAPGPNLDAAVAAVEGECTGTRWVPGEASRKVDKDYYMASLKSKDVGDVILFGFKGDEVGFAKSYSKSCQRSDGRQPNIMTLENYARVKRCYKGRVRFVDLPPRRPADLPQDPGYNPRNRLSDDYFDTDPTPGPTFGMPMWTIYGYQSKTTPGQYRYISCTKLWCDRDNLPLLESEFEGTVGRGFAKPPNTCPFCGGAPIANLKAPASGESVIVRIPKKSSGKLHKYVGVITRNKHPDGFDLPCCDTSARYLSKYMKAAYIGKLIYGKDLVIDDSEDEDEEEESEEGGPAAAAAAPAAAAAAAALEAVEEEVEAKAIDYIHVLGSMKTQYIIGNDKALTGGKIALLPGPLDTFFGQSGPRSVESRGIRPTFIEGATLFVRVGVDTRLRQPGLNLFAGLAPLLTFQNAEECQRAIMERNMVRAFESANYGTLVQEFAAKSSVTVAELEGSLPAFAGRYGYQLETNRPHVIRLYRAWTTFLKYLADPTHPKQLRHLEHLLASPGCITPRGLLLVTLEEVGGTIQVVCPTFGIPPASIFKDVPIGFMWHDKRAESWEPIVLYNGSKDAVLLFGDRKPDLELIPVQLRTAIDRWIRAWRDSSLGCGRPTPPPHVWTPERDTRTLPRLSGLKARNPITALVRDRSNRLAGVLMKTGGFFVPCLDDGALAEDIPRVFEADSIPVIPLEAYLQFYRALSAEYVGLTPTNAVFRLEDGESHIVGFRTAGGTLVPTAPAALGSSGLPEDQVDAFPWERDALILKSPDAVTAMGSILEESTASVEEQLAEAYQYLRLTLSNWLIRDASGPAFRAELASTLKSNLPLYEKRRRIDILLEPHVRSWITVTQTEKRVALSLLRKDCLSLRAEACTGSCKWAAAASAASAAEGGRCLIHAPSRREGTDVARIFTARLSDELLRYSAQKREIWESRVPIIRAPRGAVRVGDELFLSTKPKESAASILIRLGFTGQIATSFPEEMLRFAGLEEEADVPNEEGPGPGARVVSAGLPSTWTDMGFRIPEPSPDVEGARRLAFAEGTGRPFGTWEENVKKRRIALKLPGDPARPFQWSVQDFYVLAAMTLADVLIVTKRGAEPLQIRRWIAPPSVAASATGPRVDQKMFMILWGPQQLLVTKGGKRYRFNATDFPLELREAMDSTHPILETVAKGSVGPISEEEGPELEEEESEEPEAQAPVVEEPAAAAVVQAPVVEEPAAAAVVQAPEPAAAAVVQAPAAQAPEPAAAAVVQAPEAQAPEPAAAAVVQAPEAQAPEAQEPAPEAQASAAPTLLTQAATAATAVGEAAKSASESVVATVQGAASSLLNPFQSSKPAFQSSKPAIQSSKPATPPE